LPDSPERRVTYIDTKTLSGDYLQAFRAFECNGGGFRVTLKLYRTPTRIFVAINQFEEEVIFDDGKPTEGEPSVSIVRPSLWRYFDGRWHRQPDESIPKILPKRVLSKYHRDWDADRQEIGEEKFIWIDYVLSPTINDIVLMGRENFNPTFTSMRVSNGATHIFHSNDRNAS